MEFVPPNKRSDEFFRSAFEEKGLAEVVKLHMAQVKNSSKFFFGNFVTKAFEIDSSSDWKCEKEMSELIVICIYWIKNKLGL